MSGAIHPLPNTLSWCGAHFNLTYETDWTKKMCLNETYNTVRICKNLSNAFPVLNGLKQRAALSPFSQVFFSIRN
jgi:hypothetical protein